MSDFRDELRESSRYGLGHRSFGPIECGGLSVSVQASEFHYCKPRKLRPVDEYSHWEVALFDRDEWLHAADPRFDGLGLEEWWESELSTPVGSCVPTAVVQAIVDRLRANADCQVEGIR